MTYFSDMGESAILYKFVRHGRPNRVQSDRRGSPRMSQLSVFKACVIARLGITDERGANLVEYVFLLVFIALVVVIAVSALGGKVTQKFSSPVLTVRFVATLPRRRRPRHPCAIRRADLAGEPVLHVRAQRLVDDQLRRPRSSRASLCMPLRDRRPILESIRARRRVASQLTRNR